MNQTQEQKQLFTKSLLNLWNAYVVVLTFYYSGAENYVSKKRRPSKSVLRV